MEAMQEEIMNAIKEIIGMDNIDELLVKEGYFSDIDVDSILFIQIVVQLESIFGIEIDTEHLIVESYKTIFEFVDYIDGLIEAKRLKEQR